MSTMSRSTFFDGIVANLRKELPEPLRGFHTRRFGHLLKIYFANERIHYEVWVDTRREQIELGLHLEDGPASTLAYLEVLDRNILEIKHALGPDAELGRWTLSWGHLIENWPLDALNKELRELICRRTLLYIVTLQPMLDEVPMTLTPAGNLVRDRARS
jgi:hypothetical protein